MRRPAIPVTALVAARNEAANIGFCLDSLAPAERVVVLDSASSDGTRELALERRAEVVDFRYRGGYPKKRQWAIETLPIPTPWVFFIDADERVPAALWEEIAGAVGAAAPAAGYLITKGFHFLGRRFRHGGFSHAAVLLLQRGRGRFERLVEDPAGGLDMEVHERIIVDGPVGRLSTPLIHEDFKGLEAYLDRHNRYSTWEARLRHECLKTGRYGLESLRPSVAGDVQQRRRLLKRIAMRAPSEPLAWFLYHYVLRLGFLEGRAGFIASSFRMAYIRQVRAKMVEMEIGERTGAPSGAG